MNRNTSNDSSGQQQSVIDLEHLDQICMDAGRVSDVLTRIGNDVNLVAPATSCPSIFPGFGIAFSAIKVNPDPVYREVYPVSDGNLGLHKSALDRIAAALGVNWDAMASRRLDNRTHPWYCEQRVVGTYQRFDTSWAQVMDDKVVDLRDGSAQVAQIYRQSREGKDPEATVEFMRANITEHCVTKARLRALRVVGIKTSYHPTEIARPFLVARLVVTGQTDDPDLKAEYRKRMLDNMFSGGRTVFGRGPDAFALPAPAAYPPPALAAPQDAPQNPPPAASASYSQGVGNRPSGGSQRPADAPSGPVVRFGHTKGTLLSALSRDELGWYRGKIQESIDDPKREKYRASNIRHMDEIKAEVKRRQQLAADAQSAPTDEGSQK